ncbi:hypothetical protein [Paracnuella aquatica]|uniref:hypothetical protein n=1 Tax=Paracnuella aquatica TaxID=2268757 RepID=UPI0012D744F3|nr:hypothetical protein [Paracnuella aquatica]
MSLSHKIRFLQQQFIPLLRSIPHHTPPQWGKMNLQQMIEHFSDAVRLSSGRLPAPRLFTPEADLPKMQAFLKSNQPLRENIPNPMVPQSPAPPRFTTMEEAIDNLEEELQHFFAVFAANPNLTTLNPFFGNLDYEGNVLFTYKHAVHHLRQFGAVVTTEA